MRLDLKENIEFPFSDPEWALKLLKTSVCYLFLLPFPAIVGYQIAVIREAANGEDETMPEFSGANFGSLWVKGFIFSLMLGLVIMVPAMGVGAVTVGACMALEGSSSDAAAGVVICGVLLAMLLIFIGCVFMPALLLRYAMTDSASSLVDLKAAWNDMKQGPGDYALIFFFPMIASFVTTLVSATGVGMILVIPLTILAMIIQARMLGNYYRAYFH